MIAWWQVLLFLFVNDIVLITVFIVLSYRSYEKGCEDTIERIKKIDALR